jgi:predicted PolB exonuclease-like 3'-5' exonuclease
MAILVFDIETVPDVEMGRRLYQLEGLSEAETAEALFALRREKTGRDFLPHHLQRVIAISAVFSHANTLTVWSLGDESSSEKDIISRFFAGIDKHQPTLVSWNGAGFDLPVLHYRALLYGIVAPTYWEAGEQLQPFKWNNYLNRFHYRHLDLMDVLAGYQNKAFAPLDEIASMLGLPGKMGMDGSKVWAAYQAGELKQIRDYCETDVLNTYGVYLRFERMRGHLNPMAYIEKVMQLKAYLANNPEKTHWQDFLQRMHDGIVDE